MIFKFLIADNFENLVEAIKQIKEIPKLFEKKFIEEIKTYYIIVGIPKLVNSWKKDKNIEEE